MNQHWLAVGTVGNWESSFNYGNIWGLKDFRELAALWNLLQEGDKILIYASNPVRGVVGFGTVTTKFRQTKPLWPEETRRNEVIWPLRFEFELEYCLPRSEWRVRAYRQTHLQLITRMIFQCVPISLVEDARAHFGLPSSLPPTVSSSVTADALSSDPIAADHDTIKRQLREIGQLQGFLAEMEYPIDGNRLDVVWRRVELSVPTYAFEVQVSGDIYHALAKLKRAYDLWNSRIFLAGRNSHRQIYEELVSGIFREIRERARYLDVGVVGELYLRKTEYRSLEEKLGIFPT
ncbi:MAG: EVE domain-containing protein [Candidatus Acidiferrales bacterium]